MVSPRVCDALDVSTEDTRTQAHIHGFHSYPARLHPDSAARVIRGLQPKSVLDPFMGSGTVLVEARIAGVTAHGRDVNPLAHRLAALKGQPSDPEEREQWLYAGQRVIALVERARKEKQPVSHQYPDWQTVLFAPHTLMELDNIRSAIEQEADDDLKFVMQLVLSSILTKLSKKQGDSGRRSSEKRHAVGFPSRLFIDKLHELVQRHEEFSELAADAAESDVYAELDDARLLRSVAPRSIDLVLSSPPYPGVFDYVDHHRLRLDWLGLDAYRFENTEVGSRRDSRALGPQGAEEKWLHDLRQILCAIEKCTKDDGAILLMMADSSFGSRALYADDYLESIAQQCGLELVAVGSQLRPYFHAATARHFDARPRREHLVMLKPRSDRPALPPREKRLREQRNYSDRPQQPEQRNYNDRPQQREQRNYSDRPQQPEQRDYSDRPQQREQRNYSDRPQQQAAKPTKVRRIVEQKFRDED